MTKPNDAIIEGQIVNILNSYLSPGEWTETDKVRFASKVKKVFDAETEKLQAERDELKKKVLRLEAETESLYGQDAHIYFDFDDVARRIEEKERQILAGN